MLLFQKTTKKGALGRLFLCAWLLLPRFAASAGDACSTTQFDDTAQIRYVHDGDTVHLEDGRKLRLIGIDTPELKRKKQPLQPYAIEARDFLRQRVKQHASRVGLVYDRQRHDRYGRTLAHLYFENGDSVQAALLEAGLAVAYTTPPNAALHACYQQAEDRAQQTPSQIWSHEKYQARSVSRLPAESDGFRILRARVQSSRHSAKGLWLTLEGGLVLQIKSVDLDNFEAGALESLPGKNIEVRGWLHPRKSSTNTRFYMQLRHPDNLRIL